MKRWKNLDHRDQVRHAVEHVVRAWKLGVKKEMKEASRALLLLFEPANDLTTIIWSRWTLTLMWNSSDPGDGLVAVDEAVYVYAPGPPMKHLYRIGAMK